MEDTAEERAEELEKRLKRLLLSYQEIHEEFKELEKEGVELGQKIRRTVDNLKMQKIKDRINQINAN